MHPSRFGGELVIHIQAHNIQVKSIVCHAFSKLCVCKCTCTFFFLWSLLTSPATLKMRDETILLVQAIQFHKVHAHRMVT